MRIRAAARSTGAAWATCSTEGPEFYSAETQAILSFAFGADCQGGSNRHCSAANDSGAPGRGSDEVDAMTSEALDLIGGSVQHS